MSGGREGRARLEESRVGPGWSPGSGLLSFPVENQAWCHLRGTLPVPACHLGQAGNSCNCPLEAEPLGRQDQILGLVWAGGTQGSPVSQCVRDSIRGQRSPHPHPRAPCTRPFAGPNQHPERGVSGTGPLRPGWVTDWPSDSVWTRGLTRSLPRARTRLLGVHSPAGPSLRPPALQPSALNHSNFYPLLCSLWASLSLPTHGP